MKLLVATAGNFQLIDHDTRTLIRHDGYTVVMRTSFVDKWAALGQIKLVAEVSDEATDAEWREYVMASDGDLALALASFKSKFAENEPPAAEPETPPRKPRK